MSIEHTLGDALSRPLGRSAPSVVGTGLIALDVIETGHAQQYQAGGTCGNVLAILSYLGWKSYPVQRMSTERAANLVRSDLSRFGVRLDYASVGPTAQTPIIRHLIERRQGGATHRFSLRCPKCSSWLPTYRPVVARSLRDLPAVTDLASKSAVFFMDRVSAAALELAIAARDGGALVVFEPSATMSDSEMRAALALAHIVKYSHENSEKWPALNQCRAPLEIKTCGVDGLQFRRANPEGRRTRWTWLASWPVKEVADAAGAGDWCTAILVYLLGTGGPAALAASSDQDLHVALRAAQAAAAWNCGYLGARGGMYHTPKSRLTGAIMTTIENKLRSRKIDRPSEAPQRNFRDRTLEKTFELCSRCRD